MFSIYNIDDMDKFCEDISRLFYKSGLPDTDFFYHSFNMYMMPKCNLDYGHINIGFAQIGKSTSSLQQGRIFYALKTGLSLTEANHKAPIDDYLIEHDFARINVLWDNRQTLASVYDKMDEDLVVGDEGMWRSDRRNSMKSAQIAKTEDQQVFAKKHNVSIENMQLMGDMDLRPLGKAGSIILWIKRGWGMLYCTAHNFPLFNDNEFEKFKKAPELLRDFRKGKRALMAISSYVCDVYCDPLDFKPDLFHTGKAWSNPFFVEYMKVKDEKLHEKAQGKGEKRSGTRYKVNLLRRKNPKWSQGRIAKEIGITRQRVGSILKNQ
jgi:hypothetical protein